MDGRWRAGSAASGGRQLAKGYWIKKAIKHPGALHRALGVPQGKKIPEGKVDAAAHSKGRLGRMGRLAETLKGFHH